MTDEDDDGNKASVASVAKKQQFTEKNFENLRAKKDQFKTAKEMISKAREIYEVSDVFIIQIENLYDPIP